MLQRSKRRQQKINPNCATYWSKLAVCYSKIEFYLEMKAAAKRLFLDIVYLNNDRRFPKETFYEHVSHGYDLADDDVNAEFYGIAAFCEVEPQNMDWDAAKCHVQPKYLPNNQSNLVQRLRLLLKIYENT